MPFDISEHLPEEFSESSRVWIYQSDRLFFVNELFEIEDLLADFVQQWKSHTEDVKAYANVFFGRFIVLMADESQTKVSGCSTDSSVRFIKQLEQKFNVNFFNRQMLAFSRNDKVEMVPLNQLKYAIDNGLITGETLYFDNTVLTKAEWKNWIKPAKQSWLEKYFNSKVLI